MATNDINTADQNRLSEASLEGCYLETLLTVIEGVFEDIDLLCDHVPSGFGGHIRSKARLGLNLAYMATDKAGVIKRLTDEVDRDLIRAKRQHSSPMETGAVQ